jgi:hypothetical protein
VCDVGHAVGLDVFLLESFGEALWWGRLPSCLLRFCLALFLEQICHPHLGFAWIAIPFVLDRMNNVKSSDP